MSARPPADQSVRDRVTTDFETTLLLEAGAGTGKTTVLVKRILALLRAGRAPIDRIVAITFTDKAAGELKGRLRDDIEEALESASGEERERLSRAAADLERAPVSTIHAFASSLLRERPFEAGLDPGFAVAAEVASDRTFDDAWDAWLEERMARGRRRPRPGDDLRPEARRPQGGGAHGGEGARHPRAARRRPRPSAPTPSSTG